MELDGEMDAEINAANLRRGYAGAADSWASETGKGATVAREASSRSWGAAAREETAFEMD